MSRNSFFCRVQHWAHTQIPNEVHVLGPFGAGKTTFCEQLKRRQSDPDVFAHTQHVDRHTFHEDRTNIEFSLADAGGDDRFRGDWFEILRDTPPLGIIFVVDHEPGDHGNNALWHVFSALENNKKKRTRLAITKGLLVFLNKYDQWCDSLDVSWFRQRYDANIARFNSIGVTPIVRCGSAKYYDRYSTMFDEAMRDFYEVLFMPTRSVNARLYP